MGNRSSYGLAVIGNTAALDWSILSANHTANWAGPYLGLELARRVDELQLQQLGRSWDTGILVGATVRWALGS